MKMLIGGNNVGSSDSKIVDIINPATNEFIDTVPAATEADVHLAISKARNGRNVWAKISLLEREKIFNKFLDLLESNKKEIALIMARESGKPVLKAFFELDQVPSLFRGYIETAKRYNGEILVPGTETGHDGNTERDLQMVMHEPVGTVVVIIPFNAPVLLFSYKVAAALSAGNAVIVKPPSDNPLGVLMLSGLLLKAGVPGDVLQVLTGSGSKIGNLLVSDPGVNAVSFTGGTEVGVNLAQLTAKRLAPCCLELGGNDPFIVLEDADVADCARQAVESRMSNSGQICIAPKRFIIQNSIKELFTEIVLEEIKTVEVGFSDNLEAELDDYLNQKQNGKRLMGSLISEKAAIEVEKQVNHTIKQGATLLFGGNRDGAFYYPTVLSNVTRDMDVSIDMEIFGPVIPIIGFDDVEEAIAIANKSVFGLSGCIMTNDYKKAMMVARAVESGGFVINGSGRYRNQMQPFGGFKMSGNGREGLVTLGEMMKTKNIVFKDFL